MDEKSLQTLEYFKILEQLSRFCSFPVSSEKARELRPTKDVFEAKRLQELTREALRLRMTHPEVDIGGARDVRKVVDLALHGGVLTASELLDVKYTLVSARNLVRIFNRLGVQYTHLAEVAAQLSPPLGLIDLITRAISDQGEILDSASAKLSEIRRNIRIIHERLLAKLQKMITDPEIAPFLQETLVTMRDGRYVLPLRSEFKGRIHSIVHDQSASGATLFIEPIGVVELNNQYRELQLAERDEERRILSVLSQEVGGHATEINQTVDIIAELDLIMARARYAEELSATEPILVGFEPQTLDMDRNRPKRTATRATIRLFQARHPLLDQKTVVPIDVELSPQTFIMVITGPNTGGKTVTLKTVALLVLMAQSGLHIPAQSGSELSVFHSVFADIGDEQSIEQSLSTFSGHVKNIVRILESADRQSLVVLDELGAGTDPQEGSALARAILLHLVEREITALVTTHHPELKAFAQTTPGVVNACVEFDLETLRPTYHLTIGLPGRSNALAIAQRLGLPQAIIEAAREKINPDNLQVDDFLNEINIQRALARKAREEAEKLFQEAEKLYAQLSYQLQTIDDERRRIIEEAQTQATQQLEELQTEIGEIRRSLARLRKSPEPLKEIEDRFQNLQEVIEQPVQELPRVRQFHKERKRSLQPGDKVRLRKLGTMGVLTSIDAEEAEVQVGILRIHTRIADLEPVTARFEIAQDISPKPSLGTESRVAEINQISFPKSPGLELDLRGHRADEALDTLDQFLDAAFLSGLPFVRIVHGKGTGKLREVVRKALKGHPHVVSFEPGSENEGGEGVTVVKLANS